MSDFNIFPTCPSRTLLMLCNVDHLSTTNGNQNYLSFLKFYKCDAHGDTQLHILAANYPNYKTAMNKLISMTLHPVLLNRRNKRNATALHIVAVKPYPAIVRRLIMAGANPSIKDKNGWIPLHYACKTGHLAVVHALTLPVCIEEIRIMSRFARIPQLLSSLRIRNSEGLLPLDIARTEGHVEVEECLLSLTQHLDTCQSNMQKLFFTWFSKS